MAYLSESDLKKIGFLRLGRNVLISDKCSIYNPEVISIGDNCRIDDFAVISGKVTLGRNVFIAIFCNIAGGEPGVTFDDFSSIACSSQVFSQSDDYKGFSLTNPTVPDEYKKEIKLSVCVKKHVIIGANSVVLPGVTIEEGCSIGAMSLVTKSTEPWKIYIGSPAKIHGERSKEMMKFEEKYLQNERRIQR